MTFRPRRSIRSLPRPLAAVRSSEYVRRYNDAQRRTMKVMKKRHLEEWNAVLEEKMNEVDEECGPLPGDDGEI